MIHYVVGDATVPCVQGERVIAHVCNDVGGWGRGFVLALSRRWPDAEHIYRVWHRNKDVVSELPPFSLGSTVFVPVESQGSPPDWTRTWVANMIAQHGVDVEAGRPPIRYDALEACLQDVALRAHKTGATVHMPRIGCGLAKGRWSEVEPILLRTVGKSVDVYVYDFHGDTTWRP